MQLSFPAFQIGSRMPTKFTGDGDDVAPPPAWDQAPAGTQEFALVCDDPDAPTLQPWVHWILCRIPAAARNLPESVSQSSQVTGVQGADSWKTGQTIGYRGPAPPPGNGKHHYRFRLYALDSLITLPTGMDKEAVLSAI